MTKINNTIHNIATQLINNSGIKHVKVFKFAVSDCEYSYTLQRYDQLTATYVMVINTTKTVNINRLLSKFSNWSIHISQYQLNETTNQTLLLIDPTHVFDQCVGILQYKDFDVTPINTLLNMDMSSHGHFSLTNANWYKVLFNKFNNNDKQTVAYHKYIKFINDLVLPKITQRLLKNNESVDFDEYGSTYLFSHQYSLNKYNNQVYECQTRHYSGNVSVSLINLFYMSEYSSTIADIVDNHLTSHVFTKDIIKYDFENIPLTEINKTDPELAKSIKGMVD